jgi:DNA-binding MarR family transcriptional regulator
MTSRLAANRNAITREILGRVAGGRKLNQRMLAGELGVALGLANAHIRRCIDDGLVETTPGKSKRRDYTLTPAGARELARLQARHVVEQSADIGRVVASFDRVFTKLVADSAKKVILCGGDGLADIGVLCSLAAGIKPIGVWRHAAAPRSIRGVPGIVLETTVNADAVVLSVAHNASSVYHALRRRLPAERIVIPDILEFDPSPVGDAG